MYNNYRPRPNNNYKGGFLGPFLLGGIAGTIFSPYIYRPVYNPYMPYYGPRW